jgi:hypothetical protein
MDIYTDKTNQKTTLINSKAIIRFLLPGILSLVIVSCGGRGEDPEPISGTLATAARTTQLAADDTDCSNGGILVETGIDENGHGELDNDELDNAEKVCHRIDGSIGANGSDGTSGIDGTNGTNGIDGTNGINGRLITLICLKIKKIRVLLC